MPDACHHWRHLLPVRSPIIREAAMPRPRSAFTLIELLIVVVIIGILAAIAIPKFNSTKGKANAAALRSDLRNLAVSEEGYFFTNQAYSDDTAKLNFRPSPGVNLQIGTVTGGWVATATHPLSYPLKCMIFYGNSSAAPSSAMNEGVATCQ
jgi:prepilin-type N-terminal cleavage/methylation domain-containing protein